MWYTIIGLIAGALTTVSLVPQLIKILKTKSSKDVSFATYTILSIGVLLWLIYGMMVMDIPLIAANGLTFMIAASILFMKTKYG